MFLSNSERKYCDWRCYRAATAVRLVRRVCPVCGVLFEAFPWDVAKGRGRYCSHTCANRAIAKTRPRPAPRDGDKRQAQDRISKLTTAGLLPKARTLPCTDCGKPARDYDHYLGYGAAHHLDVQPVCSSCHLKRGYARGELLPRMERVPPPKIPRPKRQDCAICGRAKPPYRHGRCNRCRSHWNKYRSEWPAQGPPSFT